MSQLGSARAGQAIHPDSHTYCLIIHINKSPERHTLFLLLILTKCFYKDFISHLMKMNEEKQHENQYLKNA